MLREYINLFVPWKCVKIINHYGLEFAVFSYIIIIFQKMYYT